MDASGADKLILLVQTNPVLYDKPAAGYKVKDALKKGDIWQIGLILMYIVRVIPCQINRSKNHPTPIFMKFCTVVSRQQEKNKVQK